MPLAAPIAGAGARPASLHIFPEREDDRQGELERKAQAALAWAFGLAGPARRLRLSRQTRRALRLAPALRALDEPALRLRLVAARNAAIRDGLRSAAMPELLAVVREAAVRSLGLTPYDVQVRAALTMLDGCLVEMATGEGKSLVAALAAATAALAGHPAHVVTVNDYLARRDADGMRPLFEWLGLTVGCIEQDTPQAERPAVYARDIVYAANKQIAFDYLRDRMRMGEDASATALKLERLCRRPGGETRLPAMRGLRFAIVDEADSVLIDEARTPLILSQETDAEAERAWAETAHSLADRLREGMDFRLFRDERRIELLPMGKTRLEQLAARLDGPWLMRVQREQAVRQALAARLFYRRDEHYVVQDGQVVIVDEYTGRLMPERSWNDGLHQLVEAKEGVEVTPRKVALARNTYQRFFGRYLLLSGMTGTAREVRREIAAVYRIGTVRVPTRLPVRRRDLGTRVVRDERRKLDRIAARVRALQSEGRAVLIGTRTVAASAAMSARLEAEGVVHQVLNAMNDREEAAVIAEAGQPGRVTVATNMAGRGVHIEVAPEVLEKGGLHVMLTERHDSARIDRQLLGRTARQGQPGSAEAVLALDDELLRTVSAPLLRSLARWGGPAGQAPGRALFRRAQRSAERQNARARRALLRVDDSLHKLLAFAGRPE